MNKTKNNENKRTGKRFTAIDFLICVVVIFAAVYIGVRFFTSDSSENDSTVVYSVSYVLHEDMKDIFKVGDVVLTSDGENVIGKISNITYGPVTEKHFDLTGGVKTDDIPENSEAEIDTSEEISEIEISEEASSKEITDKDVVFDTVVQGYVEVIVTIEADIELVSGNYFLNNNALKIGGDVEITTKNYAKTGKCVSIKNKIEE